MVSCLDNLWSHQVTGHYYSGAGVVGKNQNIKDLVGLGEKNMTSSITFSLFFLFFMHILWRRRSEKWHARTDDVRKTKLPRKIFRVARFRRLQMRTSLAKYMRRLYLSKKRCHPSTSLIPSKPRVEPLRASHWVSHSEVSIPGTSGNVESLEIEIWPRRRHYN